MHFSIPDTQEFIDTAGSYVVSMFLLQCVLLYINMSILS